MRLSTARMAVAIGAMMLVAGCGGSTEEAGVSTTTAAPETTTSEATTTTVAATTSTSTVIATTTTPTAALSEAIPLTSVVGGAIRGDGWLVEPGRYTAELGDRVFTFTIPEPVVYFESDIVLALGPDTSSAVKDRFFLTEFVGVIPPDRTSEHAPHDPLVPAYTAEMPANLGTWLAAVPQLRASDQLELSSSAGLTGRAWDVEVDAPNGGTFHCPFGECIGSLVQEDEGVWVLFEGARFRLWQLAGDADGMFGFLQSRPETFDDMIALAESILEDMSVETGG